MKLNYKKIINTLIAKSGNNSLKNIIFDLHRNDVKKPKTKSRYLGLEIECYTMAEEPELVEALYAFGLQDKVQISDDGSIESPDYENTYELKVLFKEEELSRTLNKLSKFLKYCKIKTNDSCGLHVHIDMRSRNLDKCYKNLVSMQDVLFGLVDKSRWDNEYCAPVKEFNINSRHVAINKLAYSKHKTLEVRLHHGTTDMKKVENWVKLLLKVISAKSVKKVSNKQDTLKLPFIKGPLKSYIDKNFKNYRAEMEKQRLLDDELDWEFGESVG
jgi:hypothetical protein